MSRYIKVEDMRAIFCQSNSLTQAWDGFDMLPSIDIEPKRGEWIGEADGYYNGELIYDTWYCSNCDYVVDDEEPPTWNFCPNCGADMKGADDE